MGRREVRRQALEESTVDDLRLRAARTGDDEDTAPTVWTPEHVFARMVEAYCLLARTPMKTRPSQASGFWPQTYPDEDERRDVELFTIQRARFFEDERRAPLTAVQASMRDEALAWPSAYLMGYPLWADAITLAASLAAIERPLAPILHKRRLVADAKAAQRGLSSWRDLSDLAENVTRRSVDKHRRAASERIALHLHRSGVPVR